MTVSGRAIMPGSERRLAAIMIADVVGYSRLMGLDEDGTHYRMQQIQRELIEPTVVEHRGHLVRVKGDGFLCMFDSPVECVRCAIVIQQSMVGLNLDRPEAQWIRFRIGINLGDVIVQPDDVFGEGVNVAARLEQLADPGSIYISGGIYEQIRYKLVCGYQSLGDRRVKNIQDPVPIYRVLPDPATMASAKRGGFRHAAYGVAAAVILLGAGTTAWYISGQPSRPARIAEAPPPAALPHPDPSRDPAPAFTNPAVPPATSAPVPAAALTAAPAAAAATPAPAAVPAVPPTPSPNQLALAQPPRPAEPARVIEPETVALPGGTFQMGSNEDASERPVHRVTVAPFLIGKYPVTVRQWRECARAGACRYRPDGSDDAPVSNVSWADAQQYVGWLSRETQKRYRLPTEAEWEYAARAGTDTRYWWGNAIRPGYAVCKGCGEGGQPTRVGARPANPFGLYDIAGGGVTEWVEDCWTKDYANAATNGAARAAPDCRERVLRGGAWTNDPSYVRPVSRDSYDASVRYPTHGLRVAQSP